MTAIHQGTIYKDIIECLCGIIVEINKSETSPVLGNKAREVEFLNSTDIKRANRFRLRRIIMGLVSAVMTGILLFQGSDVSYATAQTAQATAKDRMVRPMISAYVFDRANMVLRDQDAAYLNQMNYSFALIEKGVLTDKHWKGIKKFQAYIKRHPNILPVLAVGGWAAEGFSDAAATVESRKVFAQSAVEMMDKYGFLGLDIDWEYPGSSVAGIKSTKADAHNLTLLLTEIRNTFDACEKQDAKHRYLTIAVGASKTYATSLEVASIAKIVDQVNIMTYDMRSSERVTGHHANLYPQAGDPGMISAVTALDAFGAQGLPKSKMMIGAAFYGRAWRQVKSSEDGGLDQKAGTTGNKTYGYTAIKDMISSGKYNVYWDDAAKATYLFDGSTFISYESGDSLTHKGKYVLDNALQGVMFWEYNQDTTGELLKALYDSMH